VSKDKKMQGLWSRPCIPKKSEVNVPHWKFYIGLAAR
jgi:hypothetical protein